MNVYAENFKRLEKILGPDWFKKEHRILKSGGLMDLHFETIGENRFALAHNYKQTVFFADRYCYLDMALGQMIYWKFPTKIGCKQYITVLKK